MKKLFYLLFIASAFLFTSCEDEEGASSVVGDWSLSGIDYTYTSTATATSIDFEVVTEGVGTGYDMDATISFTDNPNEFTGSGVYSIEVEFTALGQTYTEQYEGWDLDVNGTWSLDGDELTLVADGESATLRVVSYSDKQVVLGIMETEAYTEDGIDVEIEADIQYIFTR